MVKKRQPRTARQITRRLDESLRTLDIPPRPSSGWVKTIREALTMTQAQLGRRLGITQQSAAALETDELSGRITLDRLSRAAESLGCEVHYVLKPKESLAEMINKRAQYRASRKLGRVNASQSLEASAVETSSLEQDLANEIVMERPSDLWND